MTHTVRDSRVLIFGCATFAKRMSVRPSLCHPRESRLKGFKVSKCPLHHTIDRHTIDRCLSFLEATDELAFN